MGAVYNQLSIKERVQIERWRLAKSPVREIARVLKRSVENTNRRLRRWLPRQRDVAAMTELELKQLCDQLNKAPRKCLGWKTPAEVFRQKMMEERDRRPYPRRQSQSRFR